MFMFSKKATKIDKIFTVDLTFVVSVKSTVKISAIFVAFLENTNFKDKKILPENSHHSISHFLKQTEICSPTQGTMVGILVLVIDYVGFFAFLSHIILLVEDLKETSQFFLSCSFAKTFLSLKI